MTVDDREGMTWPPPVAVHPPALVNASVFPHVPVSPDPLPAPRPASPREWTLAELIERCATYEEYLQHRPIGYARLRKSWAVLDAAMRKRHYKQPREPWPVVFKRVRSYTERRLYSTSARLH